MRKTTGKWAKGDVFVIVALMVLFAAIIVAAMLTPGSSTGRQGRSQLYTQPPTLPAIRPTFTSDHQITYCTKTLYTDGDTGVSVSAVLPSDSGEVDLPAIENLAIAQGEDCLHAEGTCPACDELREMYRDGELDGLYRITVVPECDATGKFEVSIPIGVETNKLTRYWCDGGTLHSADSISPSGHLSIATMSSDMQGIQTPMGYVIAH